MHSLRWMRKGGNSKVTVASGSHSQCLGIYLAIFHGFSSTGGLMIFYNLVLLFSQDRTNNELMDLFRKGVWDCEITIHRNTYTISCREGWQTNQRTGKTRRIRCFFGVPIHWKLTVQEAFGFLNPAGVHFLAQTVQVVTDRKMVLRLQEVLNQSRARHDGTNCRCSHGDSTFEVLEAFQIKNLHVWRRYQRFVRSIRDKHNQHGVIPEACPPISQALTDLAREFQIDQPGNERLLLHGTRDWETAGKIAIEGFDSRVSYLTPLYGQGTYFAAQTCKSAQYATKHGTQCKASREMMGTMLFARVAVGHPFFAAGPCKERTRNSTEIGDKLLIPVRISTIVCFGVAWVACKPGCLGCFVKKIGLAPYFL